MRECDHIWGERNKSIKSPMCLLCGEDFINYKAKEIQDENADLRAKLDEAHGLNIKGIESRAYLESVIADREQECDELRQQVETITKAKENVQDYRDRYKKALDDLVDFKEKQYAKIDELESQNAALRGALEYIRNNADVNMYRDIETVANENFNIANKALTASGDNRGDDK